MLINLGMLVLRSSSCDSFQGRQASFWSEKIEWIIFLGHLIFKL